MGHLRTKAILTRTLGDSQVYGKRFQRVVSDNLLMVEKIDIDKENIAPHEVKFNINLKEDEKLYVHVSRYAWLFVDGNTDTIMFSNVFDCDNHIYEATLYINRETNDVEDLVVEEWDSVGSFEDADDADKRYSYANGEIKIR